MKTKRLKRLASSALLGLALAPVALQTPVFANEGPTAPIEAKDEKALADVIETKLTELKQVITGLRAEVESYRDEAEASKELTALYDDVRLVDALTDKFAERLGGKLPTESEDIQAVAKEFVDYHEQVDKLTSNFSTLKAQAKEAAKDQRIADLEKQVAELKESFEELETEYVNYTVQKEAQTLPSKTQEESKEQNVQVNEHNTKVTQTEETQTLEEKDPNFFADKKKEETPAKTEETKPAENKPAETKTPEAKPAETTQTAGQTVKKPTDGTLSDLKAEGAKFIDGLEHLDGEQKSTLQRKLSDADEKQAAIDTLNRAELLNAKGAGVKEIDAYTTFTEQDKDAHKGRLDKAQTMDEVKNVLSAAQLHDYKAKARGAIEDMDKLNDQQKKDFKGKVDNAADMNAVNAAVTEAKNAQTKAGGQIPASAAKFEQTSGSMLGLAAITVLGLGGAGAIGYKVIQDKKDE